MNEVPMTEEEERLWASMNKPARNPDPYYFDSTITASSGFYSPTQKKQARDPINPDYYKDEIETVDFMRANAKSKEHFIEFARLTALGYIARAGKKPHNSISQDAGKAIWWLAWLQGKDPRQ